MNISHEQDGLIKKEEGASATTDASSSAVSFNFFKKKDADHSPVRISQKIDSTYIVTIILPLQEVPLPKQASARLSPCSSG